MKKQIKYAISRIIIYFLGLFSLLWYCYFIDINLLVSFLLVVIYFYIMKMQERNIKKMKMLYLGLLFVMGFSSAFFIKIYTEFSPYYIPIPAITMLTVILFGSLNLGLLMAISLSISSAYLFQNDMNFALVLLLGSLIGGFFVHNIRRRFKIVQAGVFVSLGMLVALGFLYFKDGVINFYLTSSDVVPSAIAGIFWSFVIAGALPVFEYVFKVVTNISLLESSDFNHPLLKRLVLEAPGTYHHSLMVGNLAEVAAEAINANSLLARVGAYYHDIGKLHKPEYFSENQSKSFSHHEQLKASMSKLVIVNHVKEGIELAKKYKLNSAIIDFIEQHHGTSLVFYFYRRALEGKEEEKGEIKEDVYRYPGPKPQTKETAIVLLADSAEAACRSLESPDPQRIEEVVHTIINNKFIDGQLDECELALKDLYKIAATFKRILAAIYHSRIEYPAEKNGNINKESSEKSQSKSTHSKKSSH